MAMQAYGKAYRPSRPPGSGSGFHRTVPLGAGTPANDNPSFRPRPAPRSPESWRPGRLPSPMNAGLARGAAKAATRLIPFVGWALLAYELYELYRWWQQQIAEPQGVSCTNSIAACDTGFLGFAAAAVGSSCTPKCFGALIGSNTFPPQFLVSTGYVNVIHKAGAFNPPRYVLKQKNQYAVGTWVRSGAATFGRTAFDPRTAPLEVPQVLPWTDPSLPPAKQPSPKRRPRPYRPQPKVDPERVRRQRRRRRGPGGPSVPVVRPRPKPRVRPQPPNWPDPFVQPPLPVSPPLVDPVAYPVPAPRPAPVPGPGAQVLPRPGEGPLPDGSLPPAWQVSFDPSEGAPAPRLRPTPRRNPSRPPRGNKERKVGMSARGFGWAMWAFNFATESRDAIEAVAKALPCNVQRSLKRASPAEKLAAIYDHFEDLDVEAALTELFLNHIEDAIIGRAHGAISKGFGSSEGWANYLRSVEAQKLFTDQAKQGGKAVNAALDKFAELAGLHRVRCGRNQ